MTGPELAALRQRYGLTQAHMADAIGVTLRGYQKMEAAAEPIRASNELALRYVGLQLAVARKSADIATEEARELALAFAALAQA